MKTKKTSFSAVVELPVSCGSREVTVDVALDKDEEHLTYDEVEDAVLDYVNRCYSVPSSLISLDELEDEDFPRIIDIVINADDCESYPVISESADDSKLREDKVFSKYLVLPDARYELTPECKLWMELKREGILDEDAPFEYEKYHRMLDKSIETKEQA